MWSRRKWAGLGLLVALAACKGQEAEDAALVPPGSPVLDRPVGDAPRTAPPGDAVTYETLMHPVELLDSAAVPADADAPAAAELSATHAGLLAAGASAATSATLAHGLANAWATTATTGAQQAAEQAPAFYTETISLKPTATDRTMGLAMGPTTGTTATLLRVARLTSTLTDATTETTPTTAAVRATTTASAVAAAPAAADISMATVTPIVAMATPVATTTPVATATPAVEPSPTPTPRPTPVLVGTAIPDNVEARVWPSALDALLRGAWQLSEAVGRKDFAALMQAGSGRLHGALTEDVLAANWAAVENRLGGFQRVQAVRRADVGATPVALVDVQFERGPAVLQFVFEADERVGAFYVRPAGFSLP